MICPRCTCDWWNEWCCNCLMDITLYESDPKYKQAADRCIDERERRYAKKLKKKGK